VTCARGRTGVRERVVVFDGAFGTFVQGLDLGPDDFGGAALEGCNEMLCATRPDVIEAMHRAFLDAGVDAVETASFGSFSTVLAEYGIPERARELNVSAAAIARRVANCATPTPSRPRGCSRAESTSSSSRRAWTCCR